MTRRIVLFAILVVLVPHRLHAFQSQCQRLSFNSVTAVPNTTGWDVSGQHPMTADIQVTAGTMTATLDSFVLDGPRKILATYSSFGTSSGPDADGHAQVEITGGKSRMRLNVSSCSSCAGVFRLCGLR